LAQKAFNLKQVESWLIKINKEEEERSVDDIIDEDDDNDFIVQDDIVIEDELDQSKQYPYANDIVVVDDEDAGSFDGRKDSRSEDKSEEGENLLEVDDDDDLDGFIDPGDD